MKVSFKISTLLRWIFSVPLAWIITLSLRNFLNDNLYLSFLPFSSASTDLAVAIFSMFLGTFVGAIALLKLLPKYKKPVLFILTTSYIAYQALTNSAFGLEDFLLDLGFFAGSLLAYAVSRKGIHLKVKV